MARHWTTPAAGDAPIDTNATTQEARGVRAASIAVAALTFVPLCWRLAATAYGKACERGSYECSRRLRRYAAMLATFFVLTVVGVPGQLSAQMVEDTDTPPNIVVFVSDDMGWGQPGFNGGTEVETPNMDRLADEGVKLTQFYVQPVCAPTRASLFTGRYAWKTGMADNPDTRLDDGLLLDERTIAEALRDSSYATWLVGKWQAGYWGSERLPLQRGFDHHYGFYNGFIDSYKHVRPWKGWHEILDWHRNGRPVVESGYSTFLLAEEASQLIERHDGSRPFFLYVAFDAPHDPYQAPPEYIAQFSHLPYDLETRKQRAMVKAMDDAIGQVMDALERRGVLDETLVMFLNDNGGESEAGGNSPYRGLKRSYLEGGIRVPAVMRWPSRITAGSASDALMHVADLFPTFAGLAGADTGGGLPLDGLDVWEAIANGAESPRQEVVHSLDVIRVGDWKLLEEDGEFAKGDKSSPLQLYNIAEDPYETTNLASSETARVAELRERLVYHRPFARDAEPGAPIPGLDSIDSTDDRPVMFGEEENTAFGMAVQTALTQREAGNLGPALLRLEASGTSLKLIYNETLDADSVPPADAFTVVVNPGYRAAEVIGVELSGSEVVLTLAEAVADGNTVGLTYEVPDTGAIQDADSLEAVGITWVTVTSVPPPPPLTAEFPASAHTSLFHTGSGDAPQVIVAFNQPVVDFSASSPSISVQGATIESVLSHIVAGEPANAYVVTLTPAGTSDITVALVADQPCADGGICTAGETLLSEVPASHVIRADTTPPTVSNIEITSDPGTDRTYAVDDEIQVTVTFSETVEVTGTPELRLELGGGQRTATYEGGSGTAALVFGYTVAGGGSDMDGVGVEADSLSGGTIRDGAGHNAVLDHQAVAANASHKVDGVKPALAATGGAVVDGTTLTLTYDESLDGSSTPVPGDFTVSGGDLARTVTGVRVNGSAVELTLDVGAEHGEAGIQVSYTPGDNPIQDVPGNAAEALSRAPVTNDTPDTTPPTVRSLAITSNPGSDQTYAEGDEIEVTVRFSETVVVTGTPQMRLRVGSRTRTASYDSGTGTAALVFAYEVADGDEDTDGVSIEANRLSLNGGTIEDAADNPADLAHEAVAAQAGHKVDGVRPVFVSAAVDGASLTLTYGEALDEGSRPAPGDFTVQVDGTARSVSGVSVSGSVVILTLNPAVEHGDTGIRVSYTPDANPIRDAVGNDALGLSSRSGTNTTGAPNTDPQITSPSSFDVPENQAMVRRLVARDTDPGDEVTGWDIVGGADQGQFTITSDTGDLSFRTAPDFEAPGDNAYEVRVEVSSGAGARELEAEQTVTLRVTDEREPPKVPEAPTFSGETAESITVNWSEPDNTGPAISDYDVQYREKGTGRFIDGQHAGPGLSLMLDDLEPGTVYEVLVRATNDEGTSDWSESGEGMTITPLTVGMTTDLPPPVAGAFSLRFSFSETVTGFSANDIETGQDPACMDDQNTPVFCGPAIGGLETIDDRIFTTTVTPVTDGVAHNYTLTITVPANTATSVVGNQPNEAAALEVRIAPPGVTVPISSIGLSASPGNGQVALRWNAPQNTGGAPIVRYEYRWAESGGEFSDWMRVAPAQRSETVRELTNGTEYVFEVRGVNALGKGSAETAMATPVRNTHTGGGGGGGGEARAKRCRIPPQTWWRRAQMGRWC